MRSLSKVCRDLKSFLPLRELARLLRPNQACFLVGGAVRDMFLGRPCNDFDFTTPFDPTPLARAFARNLSGSWFFLDRKRRQSRVVLHSGDNDVCCDFSPFRATSLTADLLLRDFRINAMALRVHADTGPADFFDPLSGLRDLRRRHLSICSGAVLQQDPLRILKGLRHCKVLHLTPGSDTLKKMREAAPELPGVAAERVKRELGLLLDDEAVTAALESLLESGAAASVFKFSRGQAAAVEALLNIQRYQERLLDVAEGNYGEFVRCAMRYKFEECFSRQAALNLTVILKGVPSQVAHNVMVALKLARNTTRALKGYLDLGEGCLREAKRLTSGSRGRMWWVSGLGPDPVGGLIFLACSEWCLCSEDVQHVLNLALDFASGGPPEDFLDGRWICSNLGLKPGPLVGKAIQAVRREEMAGRVMTAEQARQFLLGRYQKTH